MIADIYDALTASDRPYKKAVPFPLKKTLAVLSMEAEQNKLDSDLVELINKHRIYEKV